MSRKLVINQQKGTFSLERIFITVYRPVRVSKPAFNKMFRQIKKHLLKLKIREDA